MALVTNYITDWFRIANSGKTVDGRTISNKDIDDMAATYNAEKQYRAMIWRDHSRWYNLGEVIEVKATDNSEGGKTLWAKIKPNDYYLQLVDAGQAISFSIEITSDYRGTGKAYLTGLGATDSPASWGTDTVKFSAEFNKQGIYFGDYVSLELLKETNKQEEKTLFEQLKELFISNNKTDSNRQGSNEMTPEQFKEIKDAIAQVSTAQSGLVKTELFTKVENDLKALTEKFTAVETENSELKTKVAALETKHSELATEFAKALAESDGTLRSEQTGSGDNEAEWDL